MRASVSCALVVVLLLASWCAAADDVPPRACPPGCVEPQRPQRHMRPRVTTDDAEAREYSEQSRCVLSDCSRACGHSWPRRSPLPLLPLDPSVCVLLATMLLYMHGFLAALLLPSAPRTPLASTRHPSVSMEASSIVGSLRSSLAAVLDAEPLAPDECAEVRSLCDQIVRATKQPPSAPATGSSPPAAYSSFQSAATKFEPKLTMAEVEEALYRLFNYYDANNNGRVTLDELVRGSQSIYDHAPQSEWATRQARAGARRMQRLFARAEDLCAQDDDASCVTGMISKEHFVGTLRSEFEKRIERGLSMSRAVAEIEANVPGRVAEIYGSE